MINKGGSPRIDLNWIAFQSKPVAIHCPTYHDIMTVLCDVNEHRGDGPLSDEEIINLTDRYWRRCGERTCVRVKVCSGGRYYIGYNQDDFYRDNPDYIFTTINHVKRKFDLGEIESDFADLSCLFGTEVEA